MFQVIFDESCVMITVPLAMSKKKPSLFGLA